MITKIPAFSLPANGKQILSEKDIIGKKTILYFYPKDNTPGCSNQATDFTSLLDDFEELNIQIIGVSPDSADSHDKFIAKKDIGFNLIADTEKQLIQAFGAWGEKQNYGKTYEGLIRSTFLLNEEGVIVKEWRNVRAKGHAQRILKEVSAFYDNK